jgi:hypothetical protein
MPIPVTDLQPGDRVVLNCPKSRVTAKRQAQFEGIYSSLADAMNGATILIAGTGTADFLEQSGRFAGFLFGRMDNRDLRMALAIDPDGSLRDEEGRKIYVEQRLGRVNRG